MAFKVGGFLDVREVGGFENECLILVRSVFVLFFEKESESAPMDVYLFLGVEWKGVGDFVR